MISRHIGGKLTLCESWPKASAFLLVESAEKCIFALLGNCMRSSPSCPECLGTAPARKWDSSGRNPLS